MKPSGRAGFNKTYKLNRPAEFQRVLKTSCRSRDAQFSVLAIPNNQPYPRLGMVVSKKNLHSAVRRNRVKRQIRESFRYNREKLCGLDIVVMVQKDVNTTDHKNMLHSLEKHWKKILRCKD